MSPAPTIMTIIPHSQQNTNMKIAIDIDGTITENPAFFSKLSQIWDDDVYVITYRDKIDRKKTIQELKSLGIKYTKLFFASSFEEKAEIIKEHGIALFFDDMPEMLMNVSPQTSVCLFRNEGNFDFEDRKWMFSRHTAKLLF